MEIYLNDIPAGALTLPETGDRFDTVKGEIAAPAGEYELKLVFAVAYGLSIYQLVLD